MLAIDQRLGDYRIVSRLGAGGMGEVYLAEDLRLRRLVALKVLPEGTAGDERSRSRLLREARAAATLDHPNICTVYEVGEAEGSSFIAMQYVEGETLAARLQRGRLDLPLALDIAAQVGAALVEAHRRGVIHLDIKPQNIMLTAGNQVKVLDFGLAKISTFEGNARTVTLISETGAISGTVPYMSPEQIRGEPLDARSDLFSFGTVLHEMIEGTNPFLGVTAADTMSAVLTREPAQSNDAAPSELRRIVRKCLEKDRERRYQTTRDLVIDLEGVGREQALAVGRAAELRSRRRFTTRRSVGAVLAVLVVVAAALAGYLYLRSDTPARLSPDDFVQITALPDAASAPALSPDGRMVAFIRGEAFLGTGQIYVKVLPNGEPVQLTNDSRGKYGPTFTPDGSRVAYTVVDQPGTPSASWDTWSVPVLGGPAARMLPNAAGLTWIGAHHVLFSEIEPGTGLHMGIATASEDRQEERRIYFPPQLRAMAHYSHLSPDRQMMLVVEMDRTGTFEPCRLVPFDGSSAGRNVGPDGSCTAAAWSPDGRWMYFSANVRGASHLWRQRFPNGTPMQLTSGAATEERGVAIAPDGSFLITSVGQSLGTLWLHDANGNRLLPLDGSVAAPRMSRDGTRIFCLVQRVGESSAFGLTLLDLTSGKTNRILSEFPIVDFDISQDERLVAFTTGANRPKYDIWLASLDRRTPPRRLASDGDMVHFGRGDELVYRSLTGTTNTLMRIAADGHGAVSIFDRSVIEVGDVSPDGEWAILASPSSSGASEPATMAVPIHGGSSRQLCSGSCPFKWFPGVQAAFLPVGRTGDLRLLRYPLRPGQVFPDASATTEEALHGAPGVLWDSVAPGPDPEVYVFTQSEQRGNLFRVPLQ